MKVLLWATTLQSDILALALHLDASPTCDLLIVAEHASSYRRSPIARLRPLTAPVVDRGDPEVRERVASFRPDVVVCDNHFPPFGAAPRVVSMWHGLGWKARPHADLPAFYAHVARLTGADPRGPNPRFLAQCYHARDRDWRIGDWGLHADSCRVVGSCFGDVLRSAAPYSREELAAEYGLDLSRKTVLVNVTWHYGRIFPGSWQPKWLGRSPFDADLAFLRQLFERIAEHDANVLFCLHDRNRYEAHYLDALHALAREHHGICLRHKDEHPDNWADLWVSDAMVSNLSSFATFFYYFERPVVHLCPPKSDAPVAFARRSLLGVRARRDEPGSAAWMNDPNDHGGLSATTAQEALSALDRAVSEPGGCHARARDWLERHVAQPAESACRRFAAELERLSRVS